MKSTIVHRKNALFYKMLNGAPVGDVFMSLIHSTELNGAGPSTISSPSSATTTTDRLGAVGLQDAPRGASTGRITSPGTRAALSLSDGVVVHAAIVAPRVRHFGRFRSSIG